jgi:hypothetical protein
MFTIGRVQGKAHLVAMCDYCGTMAPAERDEQGACILPEGWLKIGEPQEVGTVYAVPLARSTLMCPECQAKGQAEVTK